MWKIKVRELDSFFKWIHPQKEVYLAMMEMKYIIISTLAHILKYLNSVFFFSKNVVTMNDK